MVITLRSAVAEDVPDLRAVASAAYEGYVPRMGRRPAPMTADYPQSVRDGQVWVAVADGVLVGLVVLVLREDHLLLENVAVSPSAQGQGIGGRLLAFAEDHARQHGLSEVRLYTNAAMTENLAYYPRRGYVETHRAEQDGFRRVFFSKVVRIPLDVSAYETRVRSGGCFICGLLRGDPGAEHELLYDDGSHVAFLNRYPTLRGYALVAPRRHVADVVRDLTATEYLALQAVVHTVAMAINRVVPTERTYLLSLGSMQGNAHVHWHVAPLPPGVPYSRQQFHALMTENGVVPQTPDEVAELGAAIRAALSN
jgi:diadenosine tetraphosphate (Ap4A) HIT family hydrolase/GNAT superfamily N-acetyltransferase